MIDGVPVVIQTCDKYEPFWAGFFNFMEKNWDRGIGQTIYFCNEEKDVSLPMDLVQLKTGRGTFVQNLRRIMDMVQGDEIFYMLEDFWPSSLMSEELFGSLLNCFRENDMDALQVSSYLPYYDLSPSNISVMGRNLMRFEPQSEWTFNLQARFWKKGILREVLAEPEIPESQVGSAITVEMESDKKMREGKSRVFLYHYHWYPISGVAYRGEFTEIGRQMENVRMIDEFVQRKFSRPPSCETQEGWR